MADITSMGELKALQKEFSDRLESQFKAVLGGRGAAGDAALAAKTRDAERAQAAYAAAATERDAIVKFWSDRLEKLKTESARRADELKALKKQVAAAQKQGTAPAKKGK